MDTTQTAPESVTPNSIYTPFYCEENVYLLLRALEAESDRYTRAYAVFITNESRSCILFEQKAGARIESRRAQGIYVVWDYHVIAITVEASRDYGTVHSQAPRVLVHDRDSTLGSPIPLEEYLSKTFRPDLFETGLLPLSLESRFRVVSAQSLFNDFASDRSHMLISQPEESRGEAFADRNADLAARYIHPPPSYPPLCGPTARARSEKNNLFSFYLSVDPGSSASSPQASHSGGVLLQNLSELCDYPW